ncbi:MAG: HAD hydrolase-like protein [Lachnospiraceae bacterium]|nr:HAD hydrolase-like protein [Lachnospiraceae bacterium]
MKRYDLILFDLDGTLTDSCVGIAKAIQYAMDAYGIHVEDLTTLYQFAGPPLEVAFSALAPHFTEQDKKDATVKYREYYNVTGWKENKAFPGAVQMLQSLKDAGLLLGTASSKPEPYVRRICEYFGLADYMENELIGGADIERGMFDKYEVLDYVMRKCPEIPKDRIVLVGDRKYDVEGGHLLGVPVIGVSFGYGGTKELTEAGCDVIVDSFEELTAYLTEEMSDVA